MLAFKRRSRPRLRWNRTCLLEFIISLASQISAAWAAGFSSVDIYFFPDYAAGNPQNQVQQAVNYLKQNNCRYGKFWIDVEQPPNWGSCTANAAFLQNIVSTAQSLGQNVGIYTSNAMYVTRTA